MVAALLIAVPAGRPLFTVVSKRKEVEAPFASVPPLLAFAPVPRRWLRQNCARLARQLRAEGEPWLEHFDDDDEDF